MANNFFNKAKISFSKGGTGTGDDSHNGDNDLTLVRHQDHEQDRGSNVLSFGHALPFDAERAGEIKFLASEAAKRSDWKVVHYERMKLLKIKPKEVLDELIRDSYSPQTQVAKRLKSPLLTSLPAGTTYPSKPADIVVYCFPYHVESANGQYTLNTKTSKTDPLIVTITVFGAVWVIASLLMIGITKFAGFWYCFKLIPFLILPLLGLFKGLTHIRVAQHGILLESASGRSMLRARTINWHEIKRIYVEPAKEGKDVLTGKLVFDTCSGKRRVPLKKIASASQWRKLVGGLKQQYPQSELDPTLMDGLNQGVTRDPSYTKLWLDALSAPPMRERLQPLVPGIELQKGEYKIESMLGSGGQGSAYLAQTSAGKVVLKEYILPVYVDVKVRRQALEDFEHESKMLRSLNHPGIVKTLGSFVEDHRAYLVLEYIAGKSIKQLVEERGAAPENQCARLGIEMCEILEYLHAQSPSVVHQDFTPDNLLLAPDGSIKLIDFMVAKQYDDESASGAAVGKHHYMPPEQFRGKATTRSDIYALGCTLYFMLTGVKPEPMSTSHPTLQNNNVSGGMNGIVEMATMLDQNIRYQSASTLHRDLSTLLTTLHG